MTPSGLPTRRGGGRRPRRRGPGRQPARGQAEAVDRDPDAHGVYRAQPACAIVHTTRGSARCWRAWAWRFRPCTTCWPRSTPTAPCRSRRTRPTAPIGPGRGRRLGEAGGGCLLANHGMLAVGTDPAKAVDHTIVMEEVAAAYYHALAVRPPNILSGTRSPRSRPRSPATASASLVRPHRHAHPRMGGHYGRRRPRSRLQRPRQGGGWDRNGKAVGEGRADLEEIHPRPLYSEQRAEGQWEATSGAIAKLMKSIEADRVGGICITHQRESFAPVNQDNHAQYNAILWDDALEAQLAELGERFGHDELHRRTGRGPSLTSRSPRSCGWCRTIPTSPRCPQVHGRARLPGPAADREVRPAWPRPTRSGSSTPSTTPGPDDLITGIGLRPEQFCDTVRPGEVIGEVTAEAAKATGLPAGIPVVAGLGRGRLPRRRGHVP